MDIYTDSRVWLICYLLKVLQKYNQGQIEVFSPARYASPFSVKRYSHIVHRYGKPRRLPGDVANGPNAFVQQIQMPVFFVYFGHFVVVDSFIHVFCFFKKPAAISTADCLYKPQKTK